jgi:4-diphosphocytidyl-2-C-methyl-D-erythritol kinase
VKIRAPAKVNFGLRVVGKRRDGYHLLDTIMVPVSLYDQIEITSPKNPSERRNSLARLVVTCDDPAAPNGPKNLAYKAASLFLKEHGIDRAVRIHIEKGIPVGAGLGGGSSDAAATLLGLNRLFQIKSPVKKLLRLAVSIGADVPFFITAVPARARGIGERLSPLIEFPRFWLVILYPGVSVSTAWVYDHLRLKLTKTPPNTSMTSLLKDPNQFGKLLVNDLEAVTVARYPRVGALKQKLIQAGAAGALMAGSGSAVFGVFASPTQARQAFNRLRKEKGVQAFLARVLT